MKKYIGLSLFLSLLLIQSFAQPNGGWEWVSRSGTANQNPGNRAKEVETDAAGNVYVAGTFEGSMTVQGLTIATSGDATTGSYDEDVFVAKYNAAGTLQWLKKYGMPGAGNNQEALAMDIDAAGNMYVGGSYGSANSYHAFLVKFDAGGTQLWDKTDFTLFEVNGVTIGPDGNPVIMEINQTAKNIFKINALNGNVVWQVSNSNAGDNAGSIYRDFVDAAGNIYYCLFNASAATTSVAGQSFTTTGLTSYVASLDAGGNTRWVEKIDNRQLQLNYYVDSDGRSFLSLAGGAGSSWQGISTIATGTNPGSGYFELNNNGVIVKNRLASPYGAELRVKDDAIYCYKTLIGTSNPATTAYGQYIIAAPSTNTKALGVVIKYNKTTEAVVWANSCEFTSASIDAGKLNSVNISAAGKVLVAGSYSLSVKLSANTYTAAATSSTYPKDFFVAQFDQAAVPGPSITNWTGFAGNSNWNDADNWDNGIPNGSMKTNIFAGAATYPTAIPTTVKPAWLEIGPGVTIQLPLALSAPVGILNNGVVEINESGIFYGAFNSGNTPITGTGKVVIKNSGITYFGFKVLNNSLEINCATGNPSTLGGAPVVNGSVFFVKGILGGSLTVTDSNAVVSYTPTSYLAGTLKLAVKASGTYLFPVSNSNTAPVQAVILSLHNTSALQNISVSFTKTINGSAPATTAGGQAVTSLLNGGFWTIAPDAALTSGSYSVQLQEQGYTNGVSNAAQYVVLKRANSSSAWNFYGNNGTSSEAAGIVTAQAGNISSFSDFAIGIASGTVANTLPVTLSSFTAYKNGRHVQLQWTTASEINNKKFVVERSADAVNFTAIGEVAGAGSSSLARQYSFTDNAPAVGNNFYRLRQIDFDNRENISSTRLVNFKENDAAKGITIYPNPVSNSFSIKNNNGPIAAIGLMDRSGNLVWRMENPSALINLPKQIANGQYFVKAWYANGETAVFNILIER